MRLLVTNDDGIDAVGLHVLVRAMTELDGDHEIVVVAPDTEYSGAGASIGALFSMEPEIRRSAALPDDVMQRDGAPIEAWTVNGPPGLCVMFARLGAFGAPFDLIVSGINPGANVGRAVYHSGTIGAALTGRNGRVPGIAFSQAVSSYSAEGQAWDEIVAQLDFAAAGAVARTMVQALVDDLPTEPFVINVNVPDRPLGEIAGWRHTDVGVQPPRAVQTADLVPIEGEDGAFRVVMNWGAKLDRARIGRRVEIEPRAPVHHDPERAVLTLDRDEVGSLHRPGRLDADVGVAPPDDLAERSVRDVHVDDERFGRQVVDQRLDDLRGDGARGVEVELGDDLLPGLALGAVAADRLAERDARHASVAPGQRSADRAGVVHRAPDVRPGVDARHDQVERGTERAEPGEQHTESGRPIDRPGLDG